MPTDRARKRLFAALLLASTLLAARARAQDETEAPRAFPAPAARTGLEAHLSGDVTAVVGTPYSLRGTAFEVRGLATLVALPGAHLHARVETDAADFTPAAWADATAGADGRFALSVPVPLATHGRATLVVRVTDARGQDERRLDAELALASPYRLELFTDRHLYEPGETTQVWARVTDRGGAPVHGVHVKLSGGDLPADRDLTTSAAGVVHLTTELAESAEAGGRVVNARVGDGPAGANASSAYSVGRRNVERLLVDLEVTPETVPIEGEATLKVTVHSASGAPVRDANVSAEVSGVGETVQATTGPDGRVTLSLRAPAFLSTDSGWVGVAVHVRHAALGARDVSTGFALAQPMLLEITASTPAGGLVPEVPTEAWVLVATPDGTPAPRGTPVTVAGVAVRGRTFSGHTDAHGLVAVPMLVAPGGAVRRGESAPELADQFATSVDVTVDVVPPRAAHLALAVTAAALVSVRATRPVVSPGDTLELDLARRPAARGRDLVVDVYAGGRRVAVATVPAQAARARIVVPAGALGPLLISARPLDVPGASEGTGGQDVVLSRPAHPSIATLAPEHEVYPVRGTARLVLHTDAAAPHGWVALSVRDLSMHGGESRFALSFLGLALDEALLDPRTPEQELLVRSALAAGEAADTPPPVVPPLVDALGAASEEPGVATLRERGDLRDPVTDALELSRRGLAPLMTACEEALSSALTDGDASSLAAVVVGRGAQRRFRDGVIVDALADTAVGLGGGPVTPAMLTAVDPSFTFDSVARRVARVRLVKLLVALANALEPGDDGSGQTARSPLASDPPERWLSHLLRLGVIDEAALADPWGTHFTLHRAARPAVAISVRAAGWELVSPGPDGVPGTRDDVRDPFERAVTTGTPWAIASGEDALMDQLSHLAPGDETLAAIAAAYERMTEDAAEEARGDATWASASEEWGGGGTGEGTIGLGSLGTIGHGAGGGGSGYGYGSGSGGFSGRSTRSPSIRVGSASLSGGGFGALSAVIRRRFPPTLLFVPERDLDASGVTAIDVPLADAVTTYVVDAIVWDEGGWTTSVETTLRVDRDVVVDAPVPTFATVGDDLALEAAVANRGESPVDVRVARLASPALGIEASTPVAVSLRPHDVQPVPMHVTLSRAGEGVMVVGATDARGTPLDALERPLVVRPAAWTAETSGDALLRGRGTLELDVRADALPQGARGVVEVRTGVDALADAAPGDAVWAAWARALRGLPRLASESDAARDALDRSCTGDRLRCAAAIGALWRDGSAETEELTRALDQMRGLEGRGNNELRDPGPPAAALLLALAPAIAHAAERPDGREQLEAVAARLRTAVSDAATAHSDAPDLAALAAAALATARLGTADDAPLARVDELLRRAHRGLVVVGDQAWMPSTLVRAGALGPYGGAALDRHGASAALALAAAERGDADLAFTLLRTLRGTRGPDDVPTLTPAEAALGAAAAGLLTGEHAQTTIDLRVDGAPWQHVALVDGTARLDLAAVAKPGTHHIEVDGHAANVVAVVRARASVLVPYRAESSPQSPCTLAIEGETPARDERARTLVLVVRARLPRLVASPRLSVSVPAGMDVDAEARAALVRFTVRPPVVRDGELRLVLRPLRPGAVMRLPLLFRAGVAGTLHGLGAAAWGADRPAVTTVLAPRTLVVAGGVP